MTDTQWPRYEIFKQDRPGKPHESIGTVHAIDGEMALQNGRDLFARRPRCHSLWAARADIIFSKTAAELAEDDSWLAEIDPNASRETYLIFQKQTERRGMAFTTHVGEVAASSPAHALQLALETFPQDEVFVWWVCLQTAVTASQEDDIPTMFQPPAEKKYRLPNQYRTVSMMQQIKREKDE
ncbi:MAG: phenylacetic acid degradation protein [Chloroflexi bacterium]|nr:phenylacetic acid degradation protein [Chloroflexota bacterium]